MTTDQGHSVVDVQFMAFASLVCKKLIDAGHWADYIDPCSGLPMVHK